MQMSASVQVMRAACAQSVYFLLQPDIHLCLQSRAFPPLYRHIKCNMSELADALQVSNEYKCCLASRGSDATEQRFRSLPQISERALMASR